MLKLSGIKKTYITGAEKVEALRGIDLEFRKNEFVSILGQSGCGKTTLLNIIGGLDHYTEGDLIIKGKSTKEYKDRDWDTYRNHSVGFVFQSYNLIPHQTVLANVELALTLSGVSKTERRKRAVAALERVGLGDQLHKKPNQMSGGQMQRVSIARAIINDPEILLADEPTGALDSETSLQVMDILREIAKDRLVIMVTHNPELAERYSTRIIRVKDGLVTDDSMPYTEGDSEKDAVYKEGKHRSMSFLTALGLSVNNLLTKKGRTVMTCFAGSIGIIGIALILSVSNGVNRFIDKVQEDTLAKYPLTVQAESVDLAALLATDEEEKKPQAEDREPDRIYAGNNMSKMMEMMLSVPTSTNNVKDFKRFLETDKDINRYISAVQYTYPITLNLFSKGEKGEIIKSDSLALMNTMYESMGISIGSGSSSGSMLSSYAGAFSIWEEMLPGEDGEPVSPMLKEQYDIVTGHWPENENEVILVVNERNEISDFALYALGLKSSGELGELMEAVMQGKEITHTEMSWSYDELCSLTFRLILSCDYYQKQTDGTYADLSASGTGLNYLYNDANKYIEIRIAGIVKPNEDAMFSMMSGALGYTSALTKKIIEKTAASDIVKEQLANPGTDVFTGLPFKNTVKELTDDEKKEAVRSYIAGASGTEKAELFIALASRPDEATVAATCEQMMAGMTRETVIGAMLENAAGQMGGMSEETVRQYLDGMSDEDLFGMYCEEVLETLRIRYAEGVKQQMEAMTVEQLVAQLEVMELTDDDLLFCYENCIPGNYSDTTYEANMTKLGYVDIDNPDSIAIYAATFDDKNKVSDCIEEYNRSVEEVNRIKTTDYVKLLMSSVSTVINAISYVLIAFVAISLVVSSIMIGVITNISVLERTKEIGILRAVGASKGDIGRVFNAETFIVGLFSGIFGIGITLLLIIPINIILHALTDISYLSAVLPAGAGFVLVLISVLLTLIAGLIPSRAASKKDPVVALRTE